MAYVFKAKSMMSGLGGQYSDWTYCVGEASMSCEIANIQSIAQNGLQQATTMMTLQVEVLVRPALLCRQLLQQLWQAP